MPTPRISARRAAVAVLLVVAAGSAPRSLLAQATDAVPVAFVGVDVLPMTGTDTVLRGQTVLVRGARVEAVGPEGAVELPAGTRRIDARGKYLIPGLSEMHAHVPPGTATEQQLRDLLFLYVANGVTTIRGMLGAPHQLALRDRLERGEVVGPRFYVGAPSLNGNSTPDAATAERLVREHAAAGYDFLKLHPGLEPDVYDAIVRTAAEVGVTTGGHVSVEVGIARTLAARQGSIDHLDGYLEASLPAALARRLSSPTDTVSMGEVFRSADDARAMALARETRAAGVWNVPTAALWESIYGARTADEMAAWPEMRYASRAQIEAWRKQKANLQASLARQQVSAADAARMLAFRRVMLKALADEGAGLLLGTDSPQLFSVPGFSLHREAALLQESGVKPYTILESGTRNVARYVAEVLGKPADFGTIRAGAEADLVLLDANPLEDVRNLQQRAGVMVRGRWIPAEEIERGLEDIAARMGR